MKPKNFSQALDELENLTGTDLRSKLESELHDLQEKIDRLKPQLEELKTKAKEEVRRGKEKVETQVRENPWTTLGIVGVIFFVIGFIIGWRKSD